MKKFVNKRTIYLRWALAFVHCDFVPFQNWSGISLLKKSHYEIIKLVLFLTEKNNINKILSDDKLIMRFLTTHFRDPFSASLIRLRIDNASFPRSVSDFWGRVFFSPTDPKENPRWHFFFFRPHLTFSFSRNYFESSQGNCASARVLRTPCIRTSCIMYNIYILEHLDTAYTPCI